MAADVYFTTNPSEFTKVEGLYVSERNPPGFIRGADLSVLGIAGKTVRGPSIPVEITNVSRFLEIFGGRDYGSGGALINEIWRAMVNKPLGSMVVRRVAAADAVAGAVTLQDSGAADAVTVTASSPGAWSLAANNGPTVTVEAATDGEADKFNLRVSYLGQEFLYENIDVVNHATVADAQAAVDEIVGDDMARLVDLTVEALARPDDVADQPLAGGDDGTLTNTDYTDAVTELANYEGPSMVYLAGAATDQSAFNSTLVTLASQVSDRIFLTWSGTHGQTPAVEATAVDTDITTRTDRIIWCYNSPYTLDPETGLEMATPPHEWMASVLCQNDVDVHPGAQQTASQLAGIKRLSSQSLSRADLISLRAAGICTLEKLPDGFLFRSGVTTSLVSGKTEITRRRMADFLQLSAASRLRYYVKQKNTVEVRAQMAGELVAFSQSLKDQNRIIEDFEIDQETVNTAAQRAQGVEKLLWRVRLVGHILHLVLETEIGTGVVIEA